MANTGNDQGDVLLSLSVAPQTCCCASIVDKSVPRIGRPNRGGQLGTPIPDPHFNPDGGQPGPIARARGPAVPENTGTRSILIRGR